MFKKIALLLATSCIYCGCVSRGSLPESVVIKEQNLSLNELKQIVHKVIPLGIRAISANGREFISQNYIVVKGEYNAAEDARIRYWAKILVLNPSRPYDIEIEVHREVRSDQGGHIQFQDKGTDLGLANLLRTQFKDRLSKRRDDLNLLDDFRVF